jgi:prepilin-type N-terminal cleavage/methylation domain-containing protein
MENEKGLTLIELLATIVILAIVGSIIFGVLLNIQKNYQDQTSQNQLGQEANYIIAIIRNYHQKGSAYTITYDANRKVFIDGSLGKQQLGQDSQTVDILFGKDESFTREDDTVDYNPLFINVKITDQKGKSVEIDTIISNY